MEQNCANRRGKYQGLGSELQDLGSEMEVCSQQNQSLGERVKRGRKKWGEGLQKGDFVLVENIGVKHGDGDGKGEMWSQNVGVRGHKKGFGGKKGGSRVRKGSIWVRKGSFGSDSVDFGTKRGDMGTKSGNGVKMQRFGVKSRKKTGIRKAFCWKIGIWG